MVLPLFCIIIVTKKLIYILYLLTAFRTLP
jgi:hypothetical protein